MAPPKGGRLQFQTDLKSAIAEDYPHILGIKKGDSEDEFTFTFSHPRLPGSFPLEIRVHAQEIQDYPIKNAFIVYAENDVPLTVARVLEKSMFIRGMKVHDMLSNLSQKLQASLEGDSDFVTTGTGVSNSSEGGLDDSDDDVDSEYGDDDGCDYFTATEEGEDASPPSVVPLPTSLLGRVRRDFRSVLNAGFHVGRICGLEDRTCNSIISTSIRAAKLCVSGEMLEAWDLAPSDYIVLLIKYNGCYSTFEEVVQSPAGLSGLKFALRKCSKKKPWHQQAVVTFLSESAAEPKKEIPEGPELSIFRVSQSIDDLMNTDFTALLKLRKTRGFSWESAGEHLRQKLREVPPSSNKPSPSKGFQPVEDQEAPSDEAQLPSFLTADHLLDVGEVSLPLIATQFALRRLVRCTDYCAVCHQKVKGNFEALRPYVCGEPLCLYQYMHLGLGPSIEHEIINHPYVVDLLISFCYAHMSAYNIPRSKTESKVVRREFPTGLSLRVPGILAPQDRPLGTPPLETEDNGPKLVRISGATLIDPAEVIFHWDNSTVKVIGANKPALEIGQWVIVSTAVPNGYNGLKTVVVLHHARVKSLDSESIQLNVVSRHTLPNWVSPNSAVDGAPYRQFTSSIMPGHLVLCDKDLDDIGTDNDKAFAILIILASCPSVEDIRAYATSNQPLARWDRMTRAMVDLLRWIIASNTSYIVQVGEGPTKAKLTRHYERIRGVDGWVQFRFAQGSREKEELFNEVLRKITKPQKTLLAWHGSAVPNWHSIIRQGLNYEVSVNGRAFGNGIYFSRHFDASQDYASHAHESFIWPQSFLKITKVMSLNELVNLPERFKSTNPHFVVQHCHWTQCRYLFVKSLRGRESEKLAGPDETAENPNPLEGNIWRKPLEFIQDPEWVTSGPKGGRLFIPMGAIPSAYDGRNTEGALSKKKAEEPHMQSSDEDEEDIRLLFHEDEVPREKPTYETDFRPGTLDLSTLPKLAPPRNATETAQKTLGREVIRLEKIQSTTPLHQLGWYIDFAKLDNIFQWIVELHSFDPSLPLAQDMKKAGLTSIVLEIRFLRGFPISPPFVRVVRPRFLLFMNGGGGHVTSGGALCMELLTNSGWTPANSLEIVLLQVRLAICSTDPRPARLHSSPHKDYNISEAVDAYVRAARVHGWEIPADLRGDPNSW